MHTVNRVKMFHKTFGIPQADKTSDEILRDRIRLITEEYIEVLEAAECVVRPIDPATGRYEIVQMRPFAELDHEHLLKELADLDYVVAGTADTFEWDFEEAGERVHASNMSKLWEDGKPRYRDDGKVLKPDTYQPPDLKDLVV